MSKEEIEKAIDKLAGKSKQEQADPVLRRTDVADAVRRLLTTLAGSAVENLRAEVEQAIDTGPGTDSPVGKRFYAADQLFDRVVQSYQRLLTMPMR